MKRNSLILLILLIGTVCFGQITKFDTTLLSGYTFDGDTTVTVDMQESAFHWSLQLYWTGATGTLDANASVLSSNVQNDYFTLYSAAHDVTLPYSAGDTIFSTGDETFNSNWLQLKLDVNNQTTSTITAILTRWKER